MQRGAGQGMAMNALLDSRRQLFSILFGTIVVVFFSQVRAPGTFTRLLPSFLRNMYLESSTIEHTATRNVSCVIQSL